jgi:hypothetical protein
MSTRFAESEQRRRWLDASTELLPLLLSGEAGPPHALIAQHAATAATADFAALAMPHGGDQVIVTGVAGELTAGMLNRTAPLAGSLTGQAILTGQASLVTGDRRAAAAAALGAATGPLIVVPLAVGEQVRGALMLGRLATSPGFTETDLDMAVSLAPVLTPRPDRRRPARPCHLRAVRSQHGTAGPRHLHRPGHGGPDQRLHRHPR